TMRHGATPSTITLRRSVHPEYGLQHAEAARVGVHLHHAAMRDDELLADVSDHRAAIGRHAQRLDVIVEDLVEGERAATLARIAVGAFAEDESGDPGERADQLESGEQAVDAIRRFPHVLQEQEPTLEIRHVFRTGQRREHGQVAANQFTARLAAGDRQSALLAGDQFFAGVDYIAVLHQLALEEQAPELVDVEPVPAARADRAVEGDQAGLRQDRAVQRGDVGVAQQDLWIGADRVVVEQWQQADRESVG